MAVIGLFRKIINCGADLQFNEHRRQAVRLMNQLSLFVIAITIPYIGFVVYNGPIEIVAIQCFCILFDIGIIVMNYFGFFQITRFAALVMGNLQIMVISTIFGIESNTVLYYFGAIAASLFFFQKNEWVYIIFFAILTIILFLIREPIHAMFPKSGIFIGIDSFVRIVTEIGSLITIFAFVFYFYFENQKSQDKLKEVNEQLLLLSETDPLTNISNRRKFNEILELEWNRAFRGKYPLTVLFIDVDHFKMYNDQFGHQAGDHVLIQVAQAIRKSVRRSYDFVARYGGEEFVAILPETTETGSIEVAEQIRKSVMDLKISHSPSLNPDCVTISIGVATTIPEQNKNSSQLVKGADLALYKAKADSRNCVRVEIFG